MECDLLSTSTNMWRNFWNLLSLCSTFSSPVPVWSYCPCKQRKKELKVEMPVELHRFADDCDSNKTYRKCGVWLKMILASHANKQKGSLMHATCVVELNLSSVVLKKSVFTSSFSQSQTFTTHLPRWSFSCTSSQIALCCWIDYSGHSVFLI